MDPQQLLLLVFFKAIITFAKAMMVLPLKSEEIEKEEGHLGQCFGIGNDKMETKN